jgi:hypothetical protein
MERNSEEYHRWVKKQYLEGEMSPKEISEVLERDHGIKITDRSIARSLAWRFVPMRKIGDAFRLAAKRGRVHWRPRTKSPRHRLPDGTRYNVMVRDNGTCQVCGAKTDLVIDHKVSRYHGGTDDESNLQVLCWTCNEGKRIALKEGPSGSMVSGKTAE